jgi:diguanylate cyclase (GGDEF)-like protein
MYRSLHDVFGECVARNTIADLYLETGKLSLAKKEFKKASALSKLPHMKEARPYVLLGVASLDCVEDCPEKALQSANEALKEFKASSDCDRQGKALLVMAQAHALNRNHSAAQKALKNAERCFTRANLLVRRPMSSLVESRIEALRGNSEKAIAALCDAVRLSYEFSGGARGEVFFRDIVHTFLTHACERSEFPWATILVRAGGFWKYYYHRRNVFGIVKGKVLDIGTAVPEESTVLPARKEPGIPWHGRTLIAPLTSRGVGWGVLMIPYRGKDGIDELNLLSNAGPSLGAILEKKLAQRDALTGLANRRMFDSQFAEEVRRCTTLNLPIAAIMLDIDHFRNFNNTYSHEVGDLVLSEVAGVFRQGARLSRNKASPIPMSEDFSARYGGEEMIIISSGCTLLDARSAAERIRRDIEHLRIRHCGKTLWVTASLGVGYCKPGEDPSLVADLADKAMYRAKKKGRNRVECIDGDIKIYMKIKKGEHDVR